MDNPQTIIMQYQSQVLDLQGTVDRLKAELAKAKAELESEQKAHEAIAKLCFEAGAETPDGTSVGAVQELVKAYEQATEANSRLQHQKSELELHVSQARSRLQSDYRLLSESYHELRDQLAQSKSHSKALSSEVSHWKAVANYSRNTSTRDALGDLLAPTIPLIEELRQAVMYDPYTEDERSATSYEQLPLVRKADKELARLRSLLPSKENTDTKTP